MKTSPSPQTLGFFDVELRYIRRRHNPADIGLINLIYPAPAGARYEFRFRIGTATNRALKSVD